jgi:NAD(P)-dependent dehydrogenase (short-subunit alcohol dehydrogenase family)
MNRAAYAASKAGVIGLTKALARETATFGIRVNAVAPGQFDTNMSARLKTDSELRNRILDTIPLGRFGHPGEVAGVVAFLVSDDASYITGETINIDGGVMME